MSVLLRLNQVHEIEVPSNISYDLLQEQISQKMQIPVEKLIIHNSESVISADNLKEALESKELNVRQSRRRNGVVKDAGFYRQVLQNQRRGGIENIQPLDGNVQRRNGILLQNLSIDLESGSESDSGSDMSDNE